MEVNNFNRIKELREKSKLSGTEIAGKLNISAQYYYDLEKGERRLNETYLKQLADIFDVSIDYLLGRSDKKQIALPEGAYKIDEFIKIPVLCVIRAGEPILAVENIIGYEYIASNDIPSGEIFGLKVIGDSMNLAQILENNIVIVRSQETVENGEIAVVMVDGENATIKRFYRTDTTVTLMPQSSNPEHQPRVIDTKNVSVKVIGKVVQAIIKF